MGIEHGNILENLIQVDGNKIIVADGPLSEQCAKALHEVYAKEVDKETGIVLESQANDQLNQAGVWEALTETRNLLEEQGQVVGLFYGVNKSDASVSDIVKVKDSLSTMTQDQIDSSVIYIDSKIDPVTGTEENLMATAIESIANEFGVKVITNLDEYFKGL